MEDDLNMKKIALLFVITTMMFIFTSCIGSMQNQQNALQPLTLTIDSPVKAGKPYPAIMICSLNVPSVDNVKGHFYWNQEGPFEYSLATSDMLNDPNLGRCALITFNLYTGRPSTYTISGYITYRNPQTGTVHRTKIVSAGKIKVE